MDRFRLRPERDPFYPKGQTFQIQTLKVETVIARTDDGMLFEVPLSWLDGPVRLKEEVTVRAKVRGRWGDTLLLEIGYGKDALPFAVPERFTEKC